MSNQIQIRKERGTLYARIYKTDIVIVKNGKITLNRSKYKTATTKKRMNQVDEQLGLDYKVYQKNYEWYVVNPGGNVQHFKNRTITLK